MNLSGQEVVGGVTALVEATVNAVRIDADTFYPEAELARILDVSPVTLARTRWKGDGIPFCKYGRRILYRGADIITALKGSRRRSTSDEPRSDCGSE